MKLRLGLLQKLIELPSAAPTDVRQLLDDLGLEVKNLETVSGDTLFTIETLANRGDHLHALGVAREISARLITSISIPPMASELPQRKPSIPVRNSSAQCLRYALMEMTLPKEMKVRADIATFLEAGSEKHAIVDLLNYILLEIGQPMHAFDRDKIDGEIYVETSSAEEKIEGLDGKEYRVPAGSVLIRDKKKIVAVGGVIGCANSMVTLQTSRVLIESALFDPVTIRKTARAMGLSTDASYSFERGCDRDGIIAGLKRLIYLTGAPAAVAGDSNGAHVVGATILEGESPENRQISFSIERIREQMNLPRLNDVEIVTRFKHLGFAMNPTSDKLEFKVGVPSWRVWDIKNEDDLVEEYVRVHGYNKVKISLPPLDYEPPADNEFDRLMKRVEPTLHGQGFLEVITKIFHSTDQLKILEEVSPGVSTKHVAVKNAVERNNSHLKATNILHFAALAEQNHRKGVLSAKVYECGRIFSAAKLGDSWYEHERDVLTIACSGRWYANEWRKPPVLEESLAHFKGMLQALVRSLGHEMQVVPASEPYLHPGYQAALQSGRTRYGFFGAIHPLLKERMDLRENLIYAELDIEKLCGMIQQREVQEPSEFPSIRRDMTLKIDARGQAAAVFAGIKGLHLEDLSDMTILDDFKKAEETFRRVTYRLTFQRVDRSLEHAEVDRHMEQILAELKAKHGVELA